MGMIYHTDFVQPINTIFYWAVGYNQYATHLHRIKNNSKYSFFHKLEQFVSSHDNKCDL